MWADITQAREHWADADLIPDDVLTDLLSAADVQCVAYAPVLAEGAAVPFNYTLAVILQARELWSAVKRDGDVIGMADFAIRARPLTATVKSLLRPESLRKALG